MALKRGMCLLPKDVKSFDCPCLLQGWVGLSGLRPQLLQTFPAVYLLCIITISASDFLLISSSGGW